MNCRPPFQLAGLMLGLSSVSLALAQEPAALPLPDIHQLMRAVQDHQKQVEEMRENYTYTSLQTTQYIDAGGQVTKTESEEREEFFVNGNPIERAIKRKRRRSHMGSRWIARPSASAGCWRSWMCAIRGGRRFAACPRFSSTS